VASARAARLAEREQTIARAMESAPSGFFVNANGEIWHPGRKRSGTPI
jgi:hypothetical protein